MGALVPGEVTGLVKSLVTAWPVTGVGLSFAFADFFRRALLLCAMFACHRCL